MRYLLVFLFLTACAERKYLTAGDNGGAGGDKEQKLELCLAKFTSGHCLSLAWEKMPTEDDVGSFLFKTFRPNKADGSMVVETLPGVVAVVLLMPSMGHGSSPVFVDQLDTGTYRARRVFFNMKGEWEIRVQINNGGLINEAILPIAL
jgi:hypothetical protein